MTNRIYELALKAGFSSWELNPSKETRTETPILLRKFAKLMIEDFIEIVEPCKCGCCHGEPEGIIADMIIKQTKQHFGVEVPDDKQNL